MPEHSPRRLRRSLSLPITAHHGPRGHSLHPHNIWSGLPPSPLFRGWGMAAMGMTALYAAWMASGRFSPWAWLLAWLAEAAPAICIGLIAMWKKAEHAGVPLTSVPAHEFMFGFLPRRLQGGILTGALFRSDCRTGYRPLGCFCTEPL